MIRSERKSIDEIFASGTEIEDALALGVQAALRRHKLLGESIAVWQDGKAVILTADQIPDQPADTPSVPPKP